jgi:glycosyltransferase involved in cell wall biosynthesis
LERVAVLMPAYNEGAAMGESVRAALAIPGIEEVIVVDDGSDDETPFIAHDAGARVIQLERNLGKGAALNAGLAETDADIILMIDADLGPTAAETRRLLEPVIAGHADMAIAAMKAPPGHRGGFGLVMRLSRWAVRRYGGADVSAPLSGQRAIRRKVLEDIGGFASGFGAETALTIDALRKGYRIVEVPLPITHRLTGRDWRGFAHRARQFADIARTVWRRRKKEF